jgi:phospholipase C
MLIGLALVASAAQDARGQDAGRLPVVNFGPKPITPIQHVIVIFGENRSFDHVFGTYVPVRKGETIHNLFSEGIVDADGKPGPHYDKTYQYSARDEHLYEIHPGGKALYTHVPAILAGGPESASDLRAAGDTGPFQTIAAAEEYEPNLDRSYYPFLLTGATGLPEHAIDTRITDDTSLPSGVVQLTGPTLSYTDYSASPVHRFYQMWQQTDCSEKRASQSNPSGCLSDLFPWVEVSIGAGSNGDAQPAGFNNMSTGEGGTSIEFYNMQKGDAPYLKYLADKYTLSDNMHQGVMGGTGANHIMFGYADAMWYSDGKGGVATPPYNQVENPNPDPGTNNWYAEDGYSGGSYTDCSDRAQPGVEPIVRYLKSLPRPIKPNCETGHYYLLNNYNPGYNGDGTLAAQYSQFTIPPTSQPHIGDVMGAGGLSYTFFGEDWDIYLTDPAGANPKDAYCNICNVFQYATDIMTNPAQRAAHIQDMGTFFLEVKSSTLPAVSIIQPSGFADGHPASSKLQIFEGFVKNIVEKVQASDSWVSTAIFVIFDEGGGYYDSGYIQPVDFFGDGTRMPFLIVSPYSEGGYVHHGYADHVSIDKFIERNWNLNKISHRSRDNFPNPITKKDNPYVPINSPAITDLFDAFHFPAAGRK